ncbi:MAG: Hsp33 family molecular chaperone HslO [Halioglobus sp.]|nr:Hsp33 family molecular chaperone HslO [Halioglobus sp.]
MSDISDPIELTPSSDGSRRFLFEDADIRGEIVHLDSAYQEIIAIHQYPLAVSRLLGEFLAAAVLLCANLKFEGTLILQVRSEGEIPLLMVECDHQLRLRGIASGAEHATSDNNNELLRSGQLAITIDPAHGQRYQGIVPLEQGSLSNSLDGYFKRSEQLNTRVWLAADGEQAAGLLLQQLPALITPDEDQRAQQWEHVYSMAATVTDPELYQLESEQLLYQLYHKDRVRLFEPASVSFNCSCSRERTHRALSTLNPDDIEELLQEQGSITMDCDFCNQHYQFSRSDLANVLGANKAKILH